MPTSGDQCVCWRESRLSTRHGDQINDFISAIHQDQESPVALEEGRSAVAVILAIYESARSGRPAPVEALSCRWTGRLTGGRRRAILTEEDYRTPDDAAPT